MATPSLDNISDEIVVLEKKIKKIYPKPKGNVILANIRSNLDATIGRESEIKWAIEYRNELREAAR